MFLGANPHPGGTNSSTAGRARPGDESGGLDERKSWYPKRGGKEAECTTIEGHVGLTSRGVGSRLGKEG